MLENIALATEYIRTQFKSTPEVGIILGSGLGKLSNLFIVEKKIPYSDIPHFPVSTVEGHSGTLLLGKIDNRTVIAMQGRLHYYEGYDMQAVTFPVRVMAHLGVKGLIVSNAAGGVSPDFSLGDIMAITDHINFFPEHPLRGKNYEELGTRFPNMTEAYSPRLLNEAQRIAKEKRIKLQSGVYWGLQGPTFETPAEYKMIHILGADAVGMSTVPEVIVARHAGIEVVAFSIITDIGLGEKAHTPTHEEVQEKAAEAAPRLTTLIEALIPII